MGKPPQERISLGLFPFEKRRTRQRQWLRNTKSGPRFGSCLSAPLARGAAPQPLTFGERFSSYVELRAGNALLWQQWCSRMSSCLNSPATSWRTSSRYGAAGEIPFVRGETQGKKKKSHVKHQQANAELILIAADLCVVSKAFCNLHEPSRNGLKCCNCCSIAETSSENVFLLSLVCASRIQL